MENQDRIVARKKEEEDSEEEGEEEEGNLKRQDEGDNKWGRRGN